MAVLPIGNYFVFNNEILSSERFISADNEGGIYEVLRVIDEVPLFLEDHLERFFVSAQLAGIKVEFSSIQIRSLLKSLIETNQLPEGNIMISFNNSLIAYFISHKYPTPEMYRDGVVCGVLDAERWNPNAKVFQKTVRQRANELLNQNAFYEVLLVDNNGFVTEGSRSNVFFVSGGKIITAPGSQVLLGITRQKVIEIARDLEIEVIEKEILFSEIQDFDAVFLTGTSPKILPVRKVGDWNFSTCNLIVDRLIKAYNASIAKYIEENR